MDGLETTDCVPIASAPHMNPINAIAITRNAKWLFTASQDGKSFFSFSGFIRKFDIGASVKGLIPLTGLQKQGLAAEIQKVRLNPPPDEKRLHLYYQHGKMMMVNILVPLSYESTSKSKSSFEFARPTGSC